MKKNLGVIPAVYPMPVLIIAAYNSDGSVNAMNAAWGTICDRDKILLCINENHKTAKNIRSAKAFTVSLADKAHMDAADFFGIASGNETPDKFARTGYHAEKSAFVNAPVITEFPVTMECELAELVETDHVRAVVGKILNVSAEDTVLDNSGKIDPEKLEALIFDPFRRDYYVSGAKAGTAWNAGLPLIRKT